MASNSLTYIGLAFKAGKTLIGSAACEKGIRRGKISLMILQQGLSQRSIESFRKQCNRAGIDALIIEGIDRLGAAIGRNGIMVLGITDKRLADTIKNTYDGIKGSGSNEQN